MATRTVNNGGPAFPFQVTIPHGSVNPVTGQVAKGAETEIFTGLDVRDHFAGIAMQDGLRRIALPSPSDYRDIAKTSYDMAEAMLAERTTRAPVVS